jgi:GTP-binding protein
MTVENSVDYVKIFVIRKGGKGSMQLNRENLLGGPDGGDGGRGGSFFLVGNKGL